MATPTINDNVLRISSENGKSMDTVIDYATLKDAASVLRAINHTLRQKIVSLLVESKRLTVTEIYVKLRLEQSVASQQLAILRKADIVTTTRDGKFIFYSINKTRIKEISDIIIDLVN